MPRSLCEVCDELVTAWLSGCHDIWRDVFEHLHTCPVTVAACERAREQIIDKNIPLVEITDYEYEYVPIAAR